MPSAESPSTELHASAAAAIVRRYRRLLWLVSLPLFLLVALLALGQGLAAHRNALGGLEHEAARQRDALQQLAREAEQHVEDLRRFAERELITAARAPDAILAAALQGGPGRGYTLDELPQLLQPGLAQLLWPADERPDEAVLWRLQAFAALAERAHDRHAELARSYYLAWPQRHVLLYPWLPSSQLLQGLGGGDLATAVQRWYERPEFGSASAGNPSQGAFWHWVPGQASVVHGAPVYAGERFRGLVATELRLQSLARAAASESPASWWLIGPRGDVLARAGELAQHPEEAVLANARAAEGRGIAAGGLRVVALPLRSAPWTLVVARPEAGLLAQIVPELLPYALIGAGLMGLLLLGQWMLRHRVIEPVLAVMRFLSERSRDEAAAEPRLTPRWQPWIRVISATFAAQREARERERRSEATKSAIVDHALAAIITTDEQGRVAEWNPAAAAMFGLARAAALGRPVGELIIPARLRAAHEAGMLRARSSGDMRLAGQRLEMSGLRSDGSEFPIEMVLARTDVDGSHHFTAFINDISAKRQAQQEIERQREALRQSEKLTAMGSLLAGVAHELNNPLSIVLGRAALLEGKAAGGGLADDVRRIREAAERCGRIVRTFLNMARAKPQTRQAVPLNELVRAAVELLGYSLRSGGITLELALAPDLPELQADPDRLGQLVMNLIVNAQQALSAQAGERRLSIASGLDPDGQRLWLRVADNGPGVAPELRERVFAPFFTTKGDGEANGVDNGGSKGTGLGLAVARSVAREHGGELQLEDTAGGASFLLKLPLVAGPQPAQAAPAPIADAARRQLRVLVVDDETELAGLLREALEGAGFEVATAESGLVALELLAEARFDAIVSDLRMPGMDGAALWRAVRERQPLLATRMLIITGDTLSPGATDFLREAGCALLEKPFAPAEMVERVRALTEA
ncbi:hybrid sensor histidine kinase/response regulator [Roseateles violae]|uniref:histidine kinase n=1 Tax=Roseateles violae TaxID=3058042 RepID=A0ABT8DYD9_9BURK|nr:ATP-binding protein [Pelomonas sp. PFR6]MDN3922562.1 PAS domain S-box protein [Pelomonas sp. PFR6]